MTIDALKTLSSEPVRNRISPRVRSSPVSSVRRSLFGEVDHEECMNYLKKELDKISKHQMIKWNFDFINEQPLNNVNGTYQWTEACPNDIPKPYTSNRIPFVGAKTEVKCDDGDMTENEEISRKKEIESRLRGEVTVPKRKLVQTSISDFIKSKKRMSSNVISKSNDISSMNCKLKIVHQQRSLSTKEEIVVNKKSRLSSSTSIDTENTKILPVP